MPVNTQQQTTQQAAGPTIAPHRLTEQQVIDALSHGEAGDSQLLAAMYKNKLVYCHTEKSWFIFNGQNWQQDKTGQVKNLVGNSLAAVYLSVASSVRQSQNGNGAKIEDDLIQRASALRYRARRDNVLNWAASQPGLALTGQEWDGKAMLLGVKNGVIDLTTGGLRDGRPEDYIRTVSPVTWQGLNAPAPLWGQFLTDIFAGDIELISFVQRLFGYCLLGQQKEHVLPVLCGAGRNGKDTMLECLKYVLGDLANPASRDVLLDTHSNNAGSATPHTYALRHLRLAWVSESREGARLNAEQIKHLTGNSTITARPLRGEQIIFMPRFLLLLITNHKPHSSGDDYALWQRLMLIPFTQSFVDDPKLPNEHKADKHLSEKLKDESHGILAWLIRGCLEYQKQGLNPPDVVKFETEQYRQAEKIPADIQAFIDDCCVVNTVKDAWQQYTASVKAGELYTAYCEWCKSMTITPHTNVVFGKRIKRRFDVISNNPNIVYGGIGLVQI